MNCRNSILTMVGLVMGVVFGIIAFSSSHTFSLDKQTAKLAEVTNRLLEETQSYSADVKSVVVNSGRTTVFEGHFKFKWPLMMRNEIRHPVDRSLFSLTVDDGHVSWSYSPQSNTAIRYDMDVLHEKAQREYGVSAYYIDETSMRFLRKGHIGTEDVYIFEGEPSVLSKEKDRGAHPERSARMYISVNDGTVRKAAFYDSQGVETVSQTFYNVRQDLSISEKDFKFVPPEGARVIEVPDRGE